MLDTLLGKDQVNYKLLSNLSQKLNLFYPVMEPISAVMLMWSVEFFCSGDETHSDP